MLTRLNNKCIAELHRKHGMCLENNQIGNIQEVLVL
jgi:hypothetical protein